MTTWIASNAMAAMWAEARTVQPLETGGVLLGWRNDEETVVAKILGPGPYALHGRHLFIPDDKWQHARILEEYNRTSGDLVYLGDWHTHPDGLAKMSGQDISTLRRIARKVGTATMMILGADLSIEAEIGCWIGRQTRKLFLPGCNFTADEVRFFEPPASWKL